MTAVREHLQCVVCGSGSVDRVLLRIDRPDRFERHVGIPEDGYSRTWVECETCGAATNVLAPEIRSRLDTLAAGYYEVDFANSTIGDKFSKVMALPPERSDNAQRVARLHDFMAVWLRGASSTATALDIGAGTGVFLSRFMDTASGRKWVGTAVEPDPIAAAHLRGLGRFEVKETLFTSKLGLRDFDLVTLNKVVEHLADPVDLVRAAGSALRSPFGVLYVEVPDKLTISLRAPTDNILGALHYHLYDPVSISVLLSRAGLISIRTERLFEPSGKITIAAFATLPGAVDRLAAAGDS